MHDKFRQLTVAASIALASLASISAANGEEMLSGLVVSVHDGDTITVMDTSMQKHNIRLTGIDAPELSQRFGQESQVAMSKMTYGKNVRVFYEKKDMYNRVLGRVLVGDLDTNAAQVKNGMAWAYRTCNQQRLCRPNKDSIPHLGAERDAKNTSKGLWEDDSPQAPWDYRKENKPKY